MQTIEGKNFPIKDSMLAVWRNINGEFVPCSPGASELVCRTVDLDLNDYKNMVARVIDVEADKLPVGYYYAHHELKRGMYLQTDDFDEMLRNLNYLLSKYSNNIQPIKNFTEDDWIESEAAESWNEEFGLGVGNDYGYWLAEQMEDDDD